VSALVALGGAYFAYRAYVVETDLPKRVRASLGWFGKLVENKYYVDEAYNYVFVNPLRDLAGWFAGAIDKGGIDGAINGVAGITGWLGAQARRLQTGLVGLYALSILFGAVALVAWLVIR
jgi:NADH-quinone oxidoreductase subunit L